MIELKKVSKVVNEGKTSEKTILNNVDLIINKGEMLAICGKSGAGKTTLLNLIGLMDSVSSGEYSFSGESVRDKNDRWRSSFRNKNIGFVMQDYALIEEYTALENVLLPLDFSEDRLSRGERKKRAMDALARVFMSNLAKEKCAVFSGGEKQRVAIARAVVNDPAVLLADEPTGALDSQNAREVFSLLRELNLQGTTIVIVTHDRELAEQCDRIVEICDGKCRDLRETAV